MADEVDAIAALEPAAVATPLVGAPSARGG